VKGELWFWVIGALLVVSLLLREPELFVIATVLLLVAGVSYVWQRYCLTNLSYSRRIGQERAFFGEDVPLTIEIVNAKPLPLAWVEVEDLIPGGRLTLQPAHVSPSHIPGRRLLSVLLSIRWYERVRRHYTINCAARGVHTFGPATLRTGDVFGLNTQEASLSAENYLLVYPKIVPLERLGLPAGSPFGEVTARHEWLFEDPMRTIGVRDYQPGDSLRRLHWKATARAPGQALQVRVFEPTTSHRLHILLNVNTSDENWSWQGYDPQALEAAITTAASVANWATDRGFLVGLAANAKLFHSSAAVRVPPSRDPHQLMHIFEALASLVPMGSMPVESLVELEARDLAYGSTVVVVTAATGDALINQLNQLKRGGHRPVLLLVTSDEQPLARLDGLHAFAIRIEDTR
jgi:uncharacterized protein (DUF58 family)